MLASSIVTLALALVAQAGPALKLAISGSASFAGVRTAVVNATLTNTGNEIVKILNEPNTILSKMETNTFAIYNDDGVAPKFTGKLVKYIPTISSDYTTLAPGESLSTQHQLADAYDFTRSGAGKYSIEASSTFTLIKNGGLETIYATISAHEARLTGELYKPRPQLSRRATFVGCTSARQALIATAYAGAQGYADESYAYLLNHTSSTQRYTTWFGPWTSTRYQIVLTNFQKLSAHAASSNMYDCTCTDSMVAYTYASTTGQIWLCSGYWNLPALGIDSKASTIVHESTGWGDPDFLCRRPLRHWTAIAGTTDYVYGLSATKALAIGSPGNAIRSAGSYEYFAVNSPPLP